MYPSPLLAYTVLCTRTEHVHVPSHEAASLSPTRAHSGAGTLLLATARSATPTPRAGWQHTPALAGTGHLTKSLPVRQRLLVLIYVESEIGQADNLKNMTNDAYKLQLYCLLCAISSYPSFLDGRVSQAS
jgi:hypothetical protein